MANSGSKSEATYVIKRATTDLAPCIAFTVFLRGSLRAHTDAMEDLWRRLQAGWLKLTPSHYRQGSNVPWKRLPDDPGDMPLAFLFGAEEDTPGCWLLELSDRRDGDKKGAVWSFTDVAPVLGMERVSHLRILFADEPPVTTLASLGEWAISHLPLWWGSAGYIFHHSNGTMYTAHKRMAALAKRYWGVQILAMPQLQWDALRGMPGVNWLTLIGDGFVDANRLSGDALRAEAAAYVEEKVFHLRREYGLALAAGPEPLQGDINAGDDLNPYVRIAKLIQPLLLTNHSPLFGPFANAEVLHAWLTRFSDPQAWIECDIGAD